MNIQCILQRPGGSKVEFEAGYRGSNAPRTVYHFKPLDPNDPESPHVAAVDVEEHRDRLLSIPEGYRIYGQVETVAVRRPAAATSNTLANGPGVDPARVDALRETTIKELKATINTYSSDELRAGLAAERGRDDDKPRSGWIEVVEAHLG